jgi:2-amino-4-hydroxy-6-hydroxymethyldihydropteridine diphosphokinase
MSILLSTIADLYAHSPQLRGMPLAVVALGANLASEYGRPEDTVRAVLPALQLLSAHPVLMSQIMITEPVDCPPGSPAFANAVSVLSPRENVSPHGLLTELQAIETRVGRSRKGIRNEARIVDLDLISFGSHRIKSDTLALPHPRATQRLFVLEPLLQIWPDFIFPGDTITVRELVRILREGA